jgi:hypothetical protein
MEIVPIIFECIAAHAGDFIEFSDSLYFEVD